MSTLPPSPSSPAAAVRHLLAAIAPVECERVPLGRSIGRFIADASDCVTDRDSPSVDVSAMDGFAVRLADLGAGALPMAGETRIGQSPPPLPSGTAARIVTGGAIPQGADAVIKREDVVEEASRIAFTHDVARKLKGGENIRRRGENALAGSAIVRAEQLLTAARIGALASAGIRSVSLRRALRVAIVTTGDELVPEGAEEAPSPWQWHDSNGPALAALLAHRAWIGEVTRTHVADDPAALRTTIAHALERSDLLLMTGGVSMGHRDFVPACLADVGVRTLFHKIPQRPGRPILAGLSPRAQPVLALPGNPVSVLVTARRIAWPVLLRLAGSAAQEATHDALVTLDAPHGRRLSLWWHRLVVEQPTGHVQLVDGRGSGDLIAAAQSDGFIEVPPDADGPGPWPYYRWDARGEPTAAPLTASCLGSCP
jgi:molybdopterin molybdotransferase